MEAARNPRLQELMRDAYTELDREISMQPGHCWIKSACCQFGVYEHRLYVTAIEVCYYLSLQTPGPITGDSCPHLVDGLCAARDARPVGCRIFYCDPKAQHWQGPMTESYLARLKEMHEQFGLDYFYADWMEVVEAIRAHIAPDKHTSLVQVTFPQKP